MAKKDIYPPGPPRPPDPKPGGESLPQAPSSPAPPSSEVQKMVKEIAVRAAEDAVKASFDVRINRLQEEVRRGLDRASADILAQVRGSVEGKVLAALTSATSSKEFRGILQEITLWSANQALKERFSAVVKQAEEGLEARVAEAAASLAGTEAFRTAVASSVSAEVHKALEGLFGAEAKGELARVIRGLVEEGRVSLLAEMEKRIAAAPAGEPAQAPEEVRALISGFVSDQTALLGRLEGRLEAKTKDLLELRAETGKAREDAAGSAEGVDAVHRHMVQIESVLGSVQERLDRIEGERLRAVFEILSGMTGPKDLEAKIREVSGEGVAKVLKTVRAAFEEMRKKADEMVAAERARILGEMRELEGAKIAPLAAILKGLVSPGDLERRIRDVALAALAAEGLPARVGRDLFDDAMVREKVKVLAATERREARAELETQVEEVLKAKGLSEKGIPEEAIKRLVDQAVGEAVSSVKALSKQIRPVIETEVGKALKDKLKDYLSTKEVRDLVDGRAEEIKTDLFTMVGEKPPAPAAAAPPAPDLESLRKQLVAGLGQDLRKRLTEEIEQDLGKRIKDGERALEKRIEERLAASVPPASPAPAGGPAPEAMQEMIRSSITKESVQASVQNILQSDVFNHFLSSDQLKEMLDDKFKIMRNWLRNEELPRQLAKAKEETPPPPPAGS